MGTFNLKQLRKSCRYLLDKKYFPITTTYPQTSQKNRNDSTLNSNYDNKTQSKMSFYEARHSSHEPLRPRALPPASHLSRTALTVACDSRTMPEFLCEAPEQLARVIFPFLFEVSLKYGYLNCVCCLCVCGCLVLLSFTGFSENVMRVV